MDTFTSSGTVWMLSTPPRRLMASIRSLAICTASAVPLPLSMYCW